MGGLWNRWWVRLPAVSLISCLSSYGAQWAAAPAAEFILKALGLGDAYFLVVAPPKVLAWQNLALAAFVLPFFFLAEPWLWRRRPLPLGSYAAFISLFFLLFFVAMYAEVVSNINPALLALTAIIGAYCGAAVPAGAAGYGYYVFQTKRQRALPPVIPDVF